ncbi:MAG: DNA-3-methyladenine glycosylase [Patescibacteria group bacterium]
MKKKIDDSSPGRIIPHSFFRRKTLKVARELLGKYLVRKIPARRAGGGNKIIREKITETEAYVGPHDLASHSSRGRTSRNEPMFCEAGTLYVYFTYGMHWMLNIVAENGCGAAILIRGTEKVSGPARLTKHLKIDKSLNGLKLGKKSGLWIESDLKIENSKLKISRLPRIGVSYAGDWAKKPYRFLLIP